MSFHSFGNSASITTPPITIFPVFDNGWSDSLGKVVEAVRVELSSLKTVGKPGAGDRGSVSFSFLILASSLAWHGGHSGMVSWG